MREIIELHDFPKMRLSLRTLLAFEDNVFDVEQHRRLEQLLPTDTHAEESLQRIRSVVRNPALGVPGLVDQQEELDPNFVAEYLDHQMPNNVQDKFEAYCFSADKYLAEIASIHHILSNVLGEPARTSRECRLKCYNVLTTKNKSSIPHPATSEQSKHFRPYDSPPQSTQDKPATFWKRWFPVKSTPATQSPAPSVSSPAPSVTTHSAEQKKSPLWTFTIIGMCIFALWYGWQQIENQRTAQQLRNLDATETFVAENVTQENVATVEQDERIAFVATEQQLEVTEQAMFLTPPELFEPIEQAVYVKETLDISATSIEDPFAAATVAPAPVAPVDEVTLATVQEIPVAELPPITPASLEPPTISIDIVKNSSSQEQSKTSEEPMIAFQPMTSSVRMPADVPMRQMPRPTLSIGDRQTNNAPTPASNLPSAPMPGSVMMQSPQPIVQTSGTGATGTAVAVPRVLGRAVPTTQPSLIFTSPPPDAPWQLSPLPFDLLGEQYLLTAAPFSGTFELAGSFRIEMMYDTKLCILPLDSSGVPGIFVDYGRIIIHPLQPNRQLRIDTEKSSGIVSVAGTDSILFVDTFAEIFAPPNSMKSPEEQKAKTSPILGFVPKNGERITWLASNQRQPFSVNTQGSVLLQSDQYRFGEIRLPHWLGALPMTQEDRILAETCRRYFVDARGNAEQKLVQALTWLIQDESRAVRTFGFRLWGDLGQFDVPLTVLTEKREEDEAIRNVLRQYIVEVMRRDAETIDRFTKSIEIIKNAKRN